MRTGVAGLALDRHIRSAGRRTYLNILETYIGFAQIDDRIGPWAKNQFAIIFEFELLRLCRDLAAEKRDIYWRKSQRCFQRPRRD